MSQGYVAPSLVRTHCAHETRLRMILQLKILKTAVWNNSQTRMLIAYLINAFPVLVSCFTTKGVIFSTTATNFVCAPPPPHHHQQQQQNNKQFSLSIQAISVNSSSASSAPDGCHLGFSLSTSTKISGRSLSLTDWLNFKFCSRDVLHNTLGARG